MLKQKRTLTADNFFTSVNLASLLTNKNICLIGTVRKNKKELPIEFLSHKDRLIDSTLFGFNENLILVSYVPKKNKAVLLLSTFHHDTTIDPDTKKPEALLDYNQTKGGVDTVDHLIENFTCRRKTNRWTFNVFLYLLYVGAHNAYCLFKIKNKTIVDKKRDRRKQLESLALSLIDPQIKNRAEDLSRNSAGTNSAIKESIRRSGHEVNKLKAATATVDPKKRSRCYVRWKSVKTAKICNCCNKHVCKNHCKEFHTVYCNIFYDIYFFLSCIFYIVFFETFSDSAVFILKLHLQMLMQLV